MNKPCIICFESYLHKLVGLLSVEAVGETQHIRGSWFLQFTHELVEAGMNLILSFLSRSRCVGFGGIGKTQDLDRIIIFPVKNGWSFKNS